MWWLPQTSGYSYQRVVLIRIDVHPAGENPTNTPRTLPTPVHACLAYAFCGQSPYVTTFHWLPQSRNIPLHPKEVLATKDRPPQPSSWVTSFLLPCDSPGVGGRGFGPMVTHLYQLNRHRRGLQPWRCRLTTYPLPDLPSQLSSLSPNGPTRSPV
jgi:hypothetical protein